MKYINYTDKDGYVRRSLIKDTDSGDKAEFGVPAGPPDLRQLDWETIKRDVNNALASAEIWSMEDFQKNSSGLTFATNVLKRALIIMYRESEQN
jgi:hypothetical protein